MVDKLTTWPFPRRLIIGIGPAGLAIVQAFRRRLEERWGSLPSSVACLAVVGGAAQAACHEECSGVMTVALPLPVVAQSDSTPQQVRQAVWQGGPAIVSLLAEAMAQISRIGRAETFQVALKPANHSPELTCYLITALDDALGSAAFLDLAYLVRHLAHQRLNAPAQVSGLLLLPDTLQPEDPRPALARCQAALHELDAKMRPHDGHVTPWDEAVGMVQGWGPAFDHGCYLLGALNGRSLSLAQPEERSEFAAEALLQLAITPLGARCDSPLPAAWREDEEEAPHSYAGIGVAAWVYPSQALIEASARRLAGEILAAWLEEPGPSPAQEAVTAREAAAFLARCRTAPADVAEAILPAARLQVAGLWQPSALQLNLAHPGEFRPALEQEISARLDPLVARRPAMDGEARELGSALASNTAVALGQCLDIALPGRLPAAQAFLVEVEGRLRQLLAEVKATAQEHWQDLQALEAQAAQVAGEMDRLAASLPEADWRGLWRLVRRSRQWLALGRAARDLGRAGALYGALLARQLGATIEVLRCDLASEMLESALQGLEGQRGRLSALQTAIQAAQALAPGPPARLCGALGFGLEQSVLTPDLIEELYTWARGSLADVLQEIAQGPDRLSAWPGADPDGEDVVGVYLDYARQRCSRLDEVSVEDLLARVIGNDPWRRSEALQGLLASASPFLAWDETRLRDLEQQVVYDCAVIGLPLGASVSTAAGLSSPLLEGLGEILWAQVTTAGERQRVTALTTVQGLPLAALTGLDDDTTQREDRASLASQEMSDVQTEPTRNL